MLTFNTAAWEKLAASRNRAKLPTFLTQSADYAFGLVHATHRGLHTVGHGGSHYGFRSCFIRFPEQSFSVVLLCNTAFINPGAAARQVADIWLADVLGPVPERTPIAVPTDAAVSPAEAARVVGTYWSENSRLLRTVYLQDSTLMYNRGTRGENRMAPLGQGRYLVEAPFEMVAQFELDASPRRMLSRTRSSWSRSSVTISPGTRTPSGSRVFEAR